MTDKQKAAWLNTLKRGDIITCLKTEYGKTVGTRPTVFDHITPSGIVVTQSGARYPKSRYWQLGMVNGKEVTNE